AVALAQAGQRVGLMDADIYGPNIPRMLGVDEKPPVEGGKIRPLQAHGVKLISLGLIVERDAPAIWRGPIIMKVIGQFVRDVDWGTLDYFLVDLPPGTGDAQLSLAQTVHIRGAPRDGRARRRSALTCRSSSRCSRCCSTRVSSGPTSARGSTRCMPAGFPLRPRTSPTSPGATPPTPRP